MNVCVRAREGYKFTPTEIADNRIKAKYKENSSKGIVKHYENSVPESWVKNGWVIEIKKRGG